MTSAYAPEALTTGQHEGRKASNSSLKQIIFAALFVMCAGALAGAQTVSTVYDFLGGKTSGANPWYVTLVQGTNGELYGTTYNGGSKSAGTAFEVTTSGTFTLLHSFANSETDGGYPTGGMTLGTDGNFYGTTQQGGSSSQGVVFQMTPAGVITILHSFSSGLEGSFPWGPPIMASDGNLYGTTSGGKGDGGWLYKVTTTGTYTALYEFTAAVGTYPIAPPTQGTDGDLYIPLSLAGANLCGSVVKMTTAGVLNSTYAFPCGSGGAFPIGPLVQAANGDFYSTTQDGGTEGEGTIYQLTTGMVGTVLHSFGTPFGDGEYPGAGLLLATDGNYYGTTAEGGTWDDGTLFNTSTSGTYTKLYSFNNSANLLQMAPLSPAFQDTNGTLYGVSEFGGTDNKGTVFSLNMGLPAFVDSPLYTGKEGTKVLILGQHLTGTSQVTFNGAPAEFKVLADTHMLAYVPHGATTGLIAVTTPSGVVNSRKVYRVGGR
jgi:uncharacterized repeat protein (TIGR03803 family)